jgi:glycosyltransferase involved in cell wall biosynthesis
MLCLALAGRVKRVRYLGTFQGMRFPLAAGLSKWIFKIVECFSILRLDQSWVLTADDYDAVPIFIRRKLSIQDGYGFGCDIDHFDPARFSGFDRSALRSELGIAEKDFVFTFVGRLTKFKGFPLTLEAFQQLRKERSDVSFLVVGEVDTQHPIDLPDLNLIPGVHHVGWQDDPAPYLAIANAMLFPSEREGMPVCMMEAIAMGLPVITSAARGCVVLARLCNGVVVDPLSVESLASSMLGAIEKSNASEEALKLRAVLDRIEFYQTTKASYGSN